MASISNGCPICSGELTATGDNNDYEVKCVKKCYGEEKFHDRYVISIFGKVVASFNEEDYDKAYDAIEKAIAYWKHNQRYVAKWLEEPEKTWKVRETIGPAYINPKAIANVKGLK